MKARNRWQGTCRHRVVRVMQSHARPGIKAVRNRGYHAVHRPLNITLFSRYITITITFWKKCNELQFHYNFKKLSVTITITITRYFLVHRNWEKVGKDWWAQNGPRKTANKKLGYKTCCETIRFFSYFWKCLLCTKSNFNWLTNLSVTLPLQLLLSKIVMKLQDFRMRVINYSN